MAESPFRQQRPTQEMYEQRSPALQKAIRVRISSMESLLSVKGEGSDRNRRV